MSVVYPRRPFCVYLHRTGSTVFYVGSGKHSRAWEVTGRHAIWQAYVARLASYDVEIVFRSAVLATARAEERRLIARLRPCCNLRQGVSGAAGIPRQRRRGIGPQSPRRALAVVPGRSMRPDGVFSLPLPALHAPEDWPRDATQAVLVMLVEELGRAMRETMGQERSTDAG